MPSILVFVPCSRRSIRPANGKSMASYQRVGIVCVSFPLLVLMLWKPSFFLRIDIEHTAKLTVVQCPQPWGGGRLFGTCSGSTSIFLRRGRLPRGRGHRLLAYFVRIPSARLVLCEGGIACRVLGGLGPGWARGVAIGVVSCCDCVQIREVMIIASPVGLE